MREYPVSTVDEIRWDDRLCLFSHNHHFPYFVTHFANSFPIASIGGVYSDVLFNPKHAGCVYKVTLAIYNLGSTVFASPLDTLPQSDNRQREYLINLDVASIFSSVASLLLRQYYVF